MMSLSDGALFFSWFFHYFQTFLLIAIMIVLVGSRQLFQYSDKLLIFIYYLFFFLATESFMFFSSCFFSRSKTAAIVGILPYFGGYFITLAINANSSIMSKTVACLHPSAAFTIAIEALTAFEDAGLGITKFTWNDSTSGNFPFSTAIGMMFFDIFFYAVLTWYFDKVWPSEFGTRLPP